MSDKLKADLRRAAIRGFKVFWVSAVIPVADLAIRSLEAGSFSLDYNSLRNAFIAGLALGVAKLLRDAIGFDVKVL